MANSPLLVIFAGPNGSGKTTCYESAKEKDPLISSASFVNPDLIAKMIANKLGFNNVNELPDKIKPLVDLKAGKIAIEYRDKLINEKRDLVIETTASSKSILKLIDKAKDNGYRADVNFIMLRTPNLNIRRVNDRVKAGIHYVEPDVIKRRYDRAKSLIADLCVKADTFVLYDNSESKQVKLLSKISGRVFVHTKQNNEILNYVCSELANSKIKIFGFKNTTRER